MHEPCLLIIFGKERFEINTTLSDSIASLNISGYGDKKETLIPFKLKKKNLKKPDKNDGATLSQTFLLSPFILLYMIFFLFFVYYLERSVIEK